MHLNYGRRCGGQDAAQKELAQRIILGGHRGSNLPRSASFFMALSKWVQTIAKKFILVGVKLVGIKN
jgi:hypothetical protein